MDNKSILMYPHPQFLLWSLICSPPAYKPETWKTTDLVVGRELLPQTWKFNKWKSILRFQSTLSNMTTIYIITYIFVSPWKGRGGSCRAEFCPPRGGGCPGSCSRGVASSESKTLWHLSQEWWSVVRSQSYFSLLRTLFSAGFHTLWKGLLYKITFSLHCFSGCFAFSRFCGVERIM